MSDFTNIQMKKVYSLFAQRHLGLFQTGWAFYPITFKGEKYVVVLEFDGWRYATELSDLKVMARCYKYAEKKRLFRGHKGKFVFSKDATIIALDDNEEIDIRRTTTDDLEIYLQKIMKEIFHAWESEKKAQAEKEEKVTKAEMWDGVIKD